MSQSPKDTAHVVQWVAPERGTGGRANHGRDSPIDYYRGNVGHGLLVVYPVAQWPGPALFGTTLRPKLFFCFLASGFCFRFFWPCEVFPFFWPSLGVFSWRHSGVGRTRGECNHGRDSPLTHVRWTVGFSTTHCRCCRLDFDWQSERVQSSVAQARIDGRSDH